MKRVVIRAVKIAGVLVGLVLVAAGIWAGTRWDAVADIPNLPSSFEAKEMCSCLFVEGHEQEFCERFVQQSTLPSDSRVIDREARTVTVEALWITHRARYVSERFGCVLDTEP